MVTSDLSLAKSVDNPTPNAHATITFTVTVQNLGPDGATNVKIQDLLPVGLTFVSASQVTYDQASGIWTVGSLANGSSQSITVMATADAPGPFTNTASVKQSDQFDPVSGNNSASVLVTPKLADLAVSKMVDIAAPNVGDTVTFTVKVTNLGPDTATNVTIADALPAGLMLSGSPVASQGTYSGGVWTVGTLALNAIATLTIKAKVNAPPPNTSTNTASVLTSDQFDPVAANNSASAIVTPQQADLLLTKTVDNTTPNVGDTVTYKLQLSNNGPDAATNITVADTLPAGLVLFGTPSTTVGTFANGVWTIAGPLANQATATLTIQATDNSANAATNSAAITL